MEDWMENARMIVDSARAIVPADGDLGRIRAARGKGIDRAMVAQAGELGLFLMRVPEEAGGLALGMRETCALMQALGGGLAPEPIGSTIMAAALLGEAFPEEAASGALVMVTAWQDDAASLQFEGGAVGGRLNGTKIAVPGDADLFAILTEAGVAVVPRDAPGVTIAEADTLDGGRIATLHLHNVTADLLPCPQAASVVQDMVLAHSAYLLGLSDRAFRITLDYLKVREQFGRPIGSFQALQHRATEIKIRIELLRAAIMATAARFDTGADAAARARDTDRCKLRAAETAMLVAREAVQMHGAMGITDEADIGLFVRRAMTDANLFGAPMAVRARLARTLEDAV
ncbi:acyl-CoA dehydrogenase family protein [Martelella soudanensis]|uniref:acyl-CoA dehydrogenase family protein n=1 Tax=unclassified Martelella TaxID=2629616 RepID=UPI001FEF3DE1|nr:MULTISPECIES: acyl-CoA dehydrogenase family protein [unclassified Martelella]